MTEWLRRYLPLELVSITTALIGAALAELVTANPVVIAYAAAWSENIGYYGLAFSREMRALSASALPWPSRALHALRALVWEFGAAEILDSFVVRPFAMFAAIELIGHGPLSIIAGKLAADVVFYGIAILFYEKRKKSP